MWIVGSSPAHLAASTSGSQFTPPLERKSPSVGLDVKHRSANRTSNSDVMKVNLDQLKEVSCNIAR